MHKKRHVTFCYYTRACPPSLPPRPHYCPPPRPHYVQREGVTSHSVATLIALSPPRFLSHVTD
ncbi:hypothetical protein E2C01_044216 [Portunus trituberculatus]|uniref:Uncharacterized protein n=1 Tax=Portunus trituberculatus TaxID=210409 RepID=A0A5B7FZT5_PORTR|nr:hypothetical protein [Portunus trituberculatus]